jgi:transcriptional regulator with XRE-family HTH domain
MRQRYPFGEASFAIQSRMARSALNWSLEEAARHSGLHRNTISNFERGAYAGDPTTVASLRSAYEKSGVVFQEADRMISVALRTKPQQREAP